MSIIVYTSVITTIRTTCNNVTCDKCPRLKIKDVIAAWFWSAVVVKNCLNEKLEKIVLPIITYNITTLIVINF
jgi:hypothetical protein